MHYQNTHPKHSVIIMLLHSESAGSKAPPIVVVTSLTARFTAMTPHDILYSGLTW